MNFKEFNFITSIPIIIFNLVEMLCVYLIGKFLQLPDNISLIIMFLFVLVRMTLGKPLHYKNPYKCFVVTLTLFLSLFLLFHVSMPLSIVMTIFNAYIMTGKGNIDDMFLWSGKTTKYQDIIDYLKYHEFSNEVIEFENNLKRKDDVLYLIYKYRFIEGLSFEEISKRLDMTTQQITIAQDKIALAFRIFMKI